MGDTGVNVLGIPIPSSAPIFLAVVSVHILFGIAAVVTGALAMLNRKGQGAHSRFGTIYFWSLAGLFTTMSALSFMRWAEDYDLFILGVLAFASATLARFAIRLRRARLHLFGMAVSYILMITAFYVDNGKHLPVWRELPQIAFWILPSVIGVPLTLYYLIRLPKFTFGR